MPEEEDSMIGAMKLSLRPLSAPLCFSRLFELYTVLYTFIFWHRKLVVAPAPVEFEAEPGGHRSGLGASRGAVPQLSAPKAFRCFCELPRQLGCARSPSARQKFVSVQSSKMLDFCSLDFAT